MRKREIGAAKNVRKIAKRKIISAAKLNGFSEILSDKVAIKPAPESW